MLYWATLVAAQIDQVLVKLFDNLPALSIRSIIHLSFTWRWDENSGPELNGVLPGASKECASHPITLYSMRPAPATLCKPHLRETRNGGSMIYETVVMPIYDINTASIEG